MSLLADHNQPLTQHLSHVGVCNFLSSGSPSPFSKTLRMKQMRPCPVGFP